MFFNSFSFVGFFAVVLLIMLLERFVTRSLWLRNTTLLVASYWFYGSFNVGFLLILLYVTVVNFISGNAIFSAPQKRRKRIVALCSVLSLLPLLFFKYSLFICKSLAVLLSSELNTELFDGLILPVGISFFTFQALSYTIDVYRGKILQRANILDFALFVAFFPTILSGPIEKARNLLPQIGRYFTPALRCVAQGACIFIWGLFKKMVIADRLANYVDWAYGSAQYVSGTTLAVAAGFYSIQIYCDFSGYSDMALGVSKALGFDVTKNFRQPYFSRTVKEFWRKWHISLTSWFTEYVYFSLGGSRVGSKARWIFNISIIFILSGIWHGAAWNFIVWGALHAMFYLCEHFLGFQKQTLHWNRLTSFLSGCVVFLLVSLAWIFFRIESFGDASYVVAKIATDFGGGFSEGASTFTFVGTCAMLLIFICYELLVCRSFIWYDVTDYDRQLSRNIFMSIPLLLLICMFGMSSESFVYFQF